MADREYITWDYKPIKRGKREGKKTSNKSLITVQKSKAQKIGNKPSTTSSSLGRSKTITQGQSSKPLTTQNADHCPTCQMPFSVLRITSPRWHTMECMDIPITATQECPYGLNCDDTTQSHYRQFRHTLLAKMRAGLEEMLPDCKDRCTVTDDLANTTVENAKRKLDFSSSKKYISASTVQVDETQSSSARNLEDNVAKEDPCKIVRDPSETPIDLAKKKLSFSGNKSNGDNQVSPEDIMENNRNTINVNIDLPNLTSKPLQDNEKRNNTDSSPQGETNSDLNKMDSDDDEFYYDCISTLTSDTFVRSNSSSIQPKCSTSSGSVVQNDQHDFIVNGESREPETMSSTETNPNSSEVSGIQRVTRSIIKTLTGTSQTNIMSFFKPTQPKKPVTKFKTSTSVGESGMVSSVESSVENSTLLKPPMKRPSLIRQGTSTGTKTLKKDSANASAKESMVDEQDNTTSSGFQKKCPFYKKMPGTPFTVDAFCYGSVEGCTAYFLTHFHYDHYGGLRKSFAHPIYCSKATANLVERKIKVDRKYLHTIPLNTPTVVDGVEVTFMDANHCPGSVIILFKLRDGRVYLHTGDFRANTAMRDYPALQGVRVSQLYLDTTYCDPQYAFPPQDDVIRFAVNKTEEHLREKPNTLIVVGTYTIGKERIFMGIAESLKCKVCVTREKKQILDCLEDDVINKHVTLVANAARVHVVQMRELNQQALGALLEKHCSHVDNILAFEPTGWTHSSKIPSLENIRPKWSKNNVTLYGVPYSEHSSYTEMRDFCRFVRADKILPTVNNGNARPRKKMEALFESWISTPSPENKTMKQAKLGAWFSGK